MRPWNIKPGMTIKVPVSPDGMAWRDVTSVEKIKRRFGRGFMWRFRFDYGFYDSWLTFSDYNIEVKKND